jgi:hypothetical protein
MRDRRFTMHELGAPCRRISELRGRERIDAPTASATRFQDRHPSARASEFAGGHQARGAGADD